MRCRVAFLLALLSRAAAAAMPYSDPSFQGADDLLARLRAVGEAGTVLSRALLHDALGLDLDPDAAGRHSVQDPAVAPVYLDRAAGGGASLRSTVARSTMPGVVPGWPGAMLMLGLDAARVCLRAGAVRTAFDGRGEMLLGFRSHALPYEYLAVPMRDSPPTDLWFRFDEAGCAREVVFNENCFSDYGHGCRNVVRAPRRAEPAPP